MNHDTKKCWLNFGKDCPNPSGSRCWVDAGKLNREKKNNKPWGAKPDDSNFF